MSVSDTPNQTNDYVVYIRLSGTCKDKTVHGFQGMVGIIFGKDTRNCQALLCQSLYRISIDVPAGGICGAICSITSHADNTDIGKSLNSRRSRQSQLLIPSAQTIPNQMDNGFAPGKVGYFPAVIGVGSQNICQKGSRFSPFTDSATSDPLMAHGYYTSS